MRILAVVGNPKAREELNAFLEGQGHHVVVTETVESGLSMAARSTPDCIIVDELEAPQSVMQFRRVLAAGSLGNKTPVLVADPEESWKPVVDAIAKLWELGESEENLTEQDPPELTLNHPVTLVLDDASHLRRRLGLQLSMLRWRVLATSDVRRATLALLDEDVDCLLVSSRLGGSSNLSLIRSYSTVRQAHPHPFAMLVLVDEENADALDMATTAGADGIVARSLGERLLNERMRTVMRLRQLEARNRELKKALRRLEEGKASPE